MNSSKSAFAATIIVALLAIAAAIFAFWKISGDEDNGNEGAGTSRRETVYLPSEDVEIEMQEAADRLIVNNYAILKLYITRGLAHEEEPYGNRPEEGYYYAVSDEYQTLADVEKIVDETFVPEEARRIKKNENENGSAYYSGFGSVYADREGRLGINADFVPDTAYPVSWVNPSYVIIPVSDSECEINIKLHVNAEEAMVSRTMYKIEGEWYLDRFILTS